MAAAETAAIESISNHRFDDAVERTEGIEDYVAECTGMDADDLIKIQNELDAIKGDKSILCRAGHPDPQIHPQAVPATLYRKFSIRRPI